MNGLIVVLSGPSGAGKGTVYKEIEKRRKNVKKEISVTTRLPRNGEKNGVDYFFVSKQEFFEIKEKKGFLENIEYDGEYYGTLKINEELLNSYDIFFDKNAEGALKIKEVYSEAVLIYIIPKTKEILEFRRGDRGKNRMELSKNEVALAKKLDWIVVNDNLEDSVKEIENILSCVRNNLTKMSKNVKFLEEFY